MTADGAILVTGGAGYIGSHVCKALARSGRVPVAFDNLSRGHREDVRWGPFEHGDVRDAGRVAEAMRRHRVTSVIHFAAFAYVHESVEDPGLYHDNNVGGMIGLLKACRLAGVDRIVLSSSCAVYGVPAKLPIGEDARRAPITPYGHSKAVAEQMLEDYEAAYGVRAVRLRYFNACGADPEGELSEKHDPETHLIPLALLAAAGRIEALPICGDDYPTPDGSCIRDYIHVADLAAGHLLALNHLERGGAGLAVNLGSGAGHSVKQVVEAVARVTGRRPPVRVSPRRPGDPPALYADTTRAREALGFTAKRSSLDQIIADAAPSFGLSPEKVPANGF